MLESSGSASLCFHKASLLLVIFLNSLFSYQGSSAVLRQLLYSSRFLLFCQPLFYFFSGIFQKICSLLSSLLSGLRARSAYGFLSLKAPASLSASCFRLSADSFHRIPPTEAFVNRYFQYFLYFLFYFYYFLFIYTIHLSIRLFTVSVGIPNKFLPYSILTSLLLDISTLHPAVLSKATDTCNPTTCFWKNQIS